MELNSDEIKIKTIKAKKMMLLFSMLSIAMTFAGLTSAYIVSKARPDWLKDWCPKYYHNIFFVCACSPTFSSFICRNDCSMRCHF